MEIVPDFKQLASSWINTGEVGVLFAMQKKKIVFVFETGSLYVILAGLENTSRVQAKTNKQTKKNQQKP